MLVSRLAGNPAAAQGRIEEFQDFAMQWIWS
jgi:hypothetical protein